MQYINEKKKQQRKSKKADETDGDDLMIIYWGSELGYEGSLVSLSGCHRRIKNNL